MALENEKKDKERILSELKNEKRGLVKIKREQEKALEELTNAKDYSQKKKELAEEVSSLKQDLKEKQRKLREKEEEMKEQHRELVDFEEKCRKLQQLINQKKEQNKQQQFLKTKERDKINSRENTGNTGKRKKTKGQNLGINPGINIGMNLGYNNPKKQSAGSSGSGYIPSAADIQNLESQIEELQEENDKKERDFKLAQIGEQKKLNELNLNYEKLTLLFKEKDQECRLNALKINELKRQTRHTVLKPLNEYTSHKPSSHKRSAQKPKGKAKEKKKSLLFQDYAHDDKARELETNNQFIDQLQQLNNPPLPNDASANAHQTQKKKPSSSYSLYFFSSFFSFLGFGWFLMCIC